MGNVQAYSVNVSWATPQLPNGYLQFDAYITPLGSAMLGIGLNLTASTRYVIASSLKPYVNYTLLIVAKTGAGTANLTVHTRTLQDGLLLQTAH